MQFLTAPMTGGLFGSDQGRGQGVQQACGIGNGLSKKRNTFKRIGGPKLKLASFSGGTKILRLQVNVAFDGVSLINLAAGAVES